MLFSRPSERLLSPDNPKVCMHASFARRTWTVKRFGSLFRKIRAPETKGPLARAALRLKSDTCFLERRGDRQAEGLARLAEDVPRSVGLDGFPVGVVARAARREHVAGDQFGRAAL